MLLIKGFNPILKRFIRWFVKFVIKTFAIAGSLRNGSQKSEVILLIKLSEMLPFIILSAVSCKSKETYSFIWTIIFRSVFKLANYCEIRSIYLNLSINSASSAILGWSMIFRAYYILMNLQIDAKNSYFYSA